VHTSVRNPQRSSTRFLLLFVGFLVVFYAVIAVHPVNDHVVVPFTEAIARVSASLLNAAGERVGVAGTTVSSSNFSVNIENGCNGLETALLLAAAVLAFPASWAQRAIGFAGGFIAIEAINLVRVVTLFWIGAHHAALFVSAHTLVWQSLVVLAGVALFVFWATIVTKHKARPSAR